MTAAARRRLTPDEQIRHDLTVAEVKLRFGRRQRGKRWMRAFSARRRLLR